MAPPCTQPCLPPASRPCLFHLTRPSRTDGRGGRRMGGRTYRQAYVAGRLLFLWGPDKSDMTCKNLTPVAAAATSFSLSLGRRPTGFLWLPLKDITMKFLAILLFMRFPVNKMAFALGRSPCLFFSLICDGSVCDAHAT